MKNKHKKGYNYIIYWDCQREGWVNVEDRAFFVDYTPEGGDTNLKFKSVYKFYKWYNNGECNGITSIFLENSQR
jgi:hypothetical protein